MCVVSAHRDDGHGCAGKRSYRSLYLAASRPYAACSRAVTSSFLSFTSVSHALLAKSTHTLCIYSSDEVTNVLRAFHTIHNVIILEWHLSCVVLLRPVAAGAPLASAQDTANHSAYNATTPLPPTQLRASTPARCICDSVVLLSPAASSICQNAPTTKSSKVALLRTSSLTC
jgi:hypothetical protein